MVRRNTETTLASKKGLVTVASVASVSEKLNRWLGGKRGDSGTD